MLNDSLNVKFALQSALLKFMNTWFALKEISAEPVITFDIGCNVELYFWKKLNDLEE